MRQRFLATVLLAAVWMVILSCTSDRPLDSVPERATSEPVMPAAPTECDAKEMPKELRAAYIEARQREATGAYSARQEGTGVFVMENPAGLFSTALDEVGVVLSADGRPWSISVVTRDFGCEGEERAVSGAKPEADRNRVRYSRDGFEEWYVNGPLGLEQGFSLDRAPECEGTKVIRVVVGGELEARLVDDDADGRGELVRFVDEEGWAVARYADLYVKDSVGKTLPAWMTADKDEVAIHWEDAGAVYPVVVDPVFATEVVKLIKNDSPDGDGFGSSVAISGDTALIGAASGGDKGLFSGSAYVFVRTGSSWAQQAKLTAGDGAALDYFGGSVAISGDTALVGAHGDDDSGVDSGAAYVFVRTGTSWSAQGKLAASDGAADDWFGRSVAISADDVVVGSSGSDSAYVFVRTGVSWTQQAKLTADDAADYDGFGGAVTISGHTVLVGASGDDDKGLSSGSAYVFVRTGVSWTQQAKLTAVDGAAVDFFGSSVAVSGDTALVGAPYKSQQVGAAYVFVRSGGTWTQQAKLSAADGATLNRFGHLVAVSGDTALVGIDAFGSPDAVYVFLRTGVTWTQQQKLTADEVAEYGPVAISGDTALVGGWSFTEIGSVSQYVSVFVRTGVIWTQQAKVAAASVPIGNGFGYSVAVSGDTAVVGEPGDGDKGPGSGAVYVFVRTGMSWTHQAKLTADDGHELDSFGSAVAVSGDTVLVGAQRDGDSNVLSGSAYVFVRIGLSWIQQAKLMAGDGEEWDQFGWSVAVSGDTAVVGAFGDDANGSLSGAAHVFARIGGSWTHQAKLTAADAEEDQRFGFSVGVSEDTAVVGAVFDDDMGVNSGAAYVFVQTGVSWTQQGKLTAADGEADDHFGESVAVSGDTALVGARWNNGNGSAYVFARTGVSWTQQTKLSAADGAQYDGFGASVAVSEDMALVGALGDDDKGLASGSAYVFVRTGASWAQQAKLTASDGEANESFGFTVGLSENTAVVGAPFGDDNGMESGSAYVFSLFRGNGLSCTDTTQCQTGFCVDGVCCNTPCNDPCQACTAILKGTGDDGFCSPAAIGTDPHNSCTDSRETDPESCGSDGLCAAGGVCRVYAYGIACDEAECAGESVKRSICNGFGACTIDPVFEDCFNYQCEAGACKADCASDQDCAAGAFCDTANLPGTCEPDEFLGTSCSSASECQSGYCVDGVCCDSACAGECRFCAPDGICHNAEDGTDPRNKCKDDGSASCKQDGMCNGAGLCRLYEYGDECGASLCLGDFRYHHQICNGLGACAPDPSTLATCLPYACIQGACKTDCAADADCADGFGCRNDKCVPVTAVCVDENTSQAADGTSTECSPYKCAQDTGECLRVCSSIDDCTSPNVCDETKTCVPPPSSEAPAGCDCHAAGQGSQRPGMSLALFAVTMLVLRRIRNRSQRRRSPSLTVRPTAGVVSLET